MTAVLLLSASLSCQPSHSTGSSGSAIPAGSSQTESRAWPGPARDLSRDEAAGGHVLRKHVDRTDDELRDRLEREHHIAAASTYTDRATAEHAIGTAIAESQNRIQSWLNRSGARPNLVLDYDASQPIGRTINRGEQQSHPCSKAVVVLKYAVASYYVLTSYPECRS
jgi:hypothetical protein